MDPTRHDRIVMGVVGRPHGVRGLVRVASHATDPALLARHLLHDDRGGAWRLEWRGEGIAALRAPDGRALAGRDEAARLTNARLSIDRAAMPPTGEDEFYFADLLGMDAFDERGARLGAVARVHDYGAGASLEIADGSGAEFLVAFTRDAVPEVDCGARRLVVRPPVELEWHGDAPEAAGADAAAPVRAAHADTRGPAA